MGENDFTNDAVEKENPGQEIQESLENVPVENVYGADTAEKPAEEVVNGSGEIRDEENVADGDAGPVAESDGDASEETDSATSETKDYSAELAGYRAYRRKNIRQEESAPAKTDKKSAVQKFSDIKIGSISLYTVALTVFTLFDLFAMHLFTSKQSYNIADKILASLGFDALHFTNITYEQICLGLGYFVAFILGGVVILILMKILGKLFSQFTDWKIGSYCPIIALGIFAVIFIIGFAVSYFSKDAVLVRNVFRWGAPALAYIGGLVFYGASKLHVGIEY